jgi:hypothetical protein
VPLALTAITDAEIEARRDELIDLLPRALSADDDGRRSAEAVCEPVALVDLVLDQVIQRFGELIDPELCPDEAVPLLAELVGLGPRLAPVRASTVAQLRALIPSAIRAWRRAGTTTSWRAFVRAVGAARSLFVSWHDVLIDVSEATPELWVLPGPGLAPGGCGDPNDYPDSTLDVWIMDPAGTTDLELIGQWLNLVRQWGGRINVIRALLVEDLLNGRSLWRDIAGASTWDQDDPALVLASGAALGVDLDSAALAWTAYRALVRVEHADAFRFLVHADGYAVPLSAYVVTVDPAAETVVISRTNAGTLPGTTLATASGVGLGASATGDWRIDVIELASGCEIAVYLDGDEVIRYADTSGSAVTAGTFGVQNHGAADLKIRGALITEPYPDLVQVGV